MGRARIDSFVIGASMLCAGERGSLAQGLASRGAARAAGEPAARGSRVPLPHLLLTALSDWLKVRCKKSPSRASMRGRPAMVDRRTQPSSWASLTLTLVLGLL